MADFVDSTYKPSQEEIIYEFGFSSPAHFTKFCKKWLGMTPTKFIEEQKMTGEHIDL